MQNFICNITKKFGWDEGDLKLQKIANFLSTNFYLPKGLAFRVYGDDFIVLNEGLIDIEKILEPINEEFKLFDITITYTTIDIEKDKITDLKELDNVF